MPSENAERAESAQHPIDLLSSLPRASRALFKRLTSYPTWSEQGWAHPSDEHLREEADYRDKRPIQRARKPLVALGLVEHKEVRRGELLPNGERARYRHWIYVAGAGVCPPSNDGGGEPAPEDRCEKGTDTVPKDPRIGAILAPRSVDPERSEIDRSSDPPEPPPAPTHDASAPDRTSLCSEGSTNEPLRTSPVRSPDVATPVVACEVARYFVRATGLGWKTIREDVVSYLTPFLDGMNGNAASKVTRACQVIDAAVLETPKPTLRYVFHPEIFWKRLDALTNPTAKPLARASRRRLDASAVDAAPPRAAPRVRPLEGTAAAPQTACSTATAADTPWTPRTLAVSPTYAAPRTPEEQAELEELYRIDTEARARRGLPPRFPVSHAA